MGGPAKRYAKGKKPNIVWFNQNRKTGRGRKQISLVLELSRGSGNDCLMDTRFPFRVMKVFCSQEWWLLNIVSPGNPSALDTLK